MIFAVDAGNTHIVIGCIEQDTILFTERIATNTSKTELEYAIDFKIILDLYQISPNEVEGSIISSVVPPISNILKQAVFKILKKEPLLVGPGTKTGLKIMIDNPAQLGSDLVVGAVAVLDQYPLPAIIIDMGTATTISVINKKQQFIGGSIIPGVFVALNSLCSTTSQLPSISLDAPKKIIATNTIDCMKSGIIYGNAAMLDGMIDRFHAELGEAATVISTGGTAQFILPYCTHKILYDDNLMLKGLSILYKKNK